MFGFYSKYNNKPKHLAKKRHDLIYTLKRSFWLLGQKWIEEGRGTRVTTESTRKKLWRVPGGVVARLRGTSMELEGSGWN